MARPPPTPSCWNCGIKVTTTQHNFKTLEMYTWLNARNVYLVRVCSTYQVVTKLLQQVPVVVLERFLDRVVIT